LDCGFWIADLLYRFALSNFIESIEYIKSQIRNRSGIKLGSFLKSKMPKNAQFSTAQV